LRVEVGAGDATALVLVESPLHIGELHRDGADHVRSLVRWTTLLQREEGVAAHINVPFQHFEGVSGLERGLGIRERVVGYHELDLPRTYQVSVRETEAYPVYAHAQDKQQLSDRPVRSDPLPSP
jgi:hypothetical protein